MIIGLTGLPGSGKDTFFHNLAQYCKDDGLELERVSVGDEVRKDLHSFIKKHYGIDVMVDDLDNSQRAEKELIRPLLKAHGICKRIQNPDYWLERIKPTLKKLTENKIIPVLTDVRFLNEVRFIQASGGIVIHLSNGHTAISNWPDSPELLQCFEVSNYIYELNHVESLSMNKKDPEDYLAQNSKYIKHLSGVLNGLIIKD